MDKMTVWRIMVIQIRHYCHINRRDLACPTWERCVRRAVSKKWKVFREEREILVLRNMTKGKLKRVTVTTVEWTKLRVIVALQSHFSNDMFSYL